ncbi:Uncharacterised protein [Staphylococcus aureus]|nr:Uncharacterised protein [Staphylococcus aureus]
MYFVLAIFTIISASVSLGYSIQACASSHNINAYYALSRSLPLFLLAIFSLVIHSAIFLINYIHCNDLSSIFRCDCWL